MQTASFELSKELFKLSKWDTGAWNGRAGVRVAPKYSLGYLLRKLPAHTLSKRTDGQWRITRSIGHGKSIKILADTPEDAAAKLCIELFKQGILEKHE